jgi:hypothetical protein
MTRPESRPPQGLNADDALAGLIARLEAATEGSRELSVNIYETLGLPPLYGTTIDRLYPDYTTSIDAALSLIPEGWVVANISQNDNRLWWTSLNRGYRSSYDATAIAGDCATPALALVIAALRARAAGEKP